MSPPDLAYIAIAARDVADVCNVLGGDLGLEVAEVAGPEDKIAAFAVGRTALLVFPQGHPFLAHGRTGVDHIALAHPAPGEAGELFGLRGTIAPGLRGTSQVRFDACETAGVDVRAAEPLDLAFSQGGHVERVDHIGIASVDNRTAEEIFAERMGCPVESRQTDMEVRTVVESFTSDTYGVVYHSRPPEPVGGLRVSFLGVGDTELEFLEEFDPARGADVTHGAPGTTRQDQGAIGRYIARRGAGLHHLALKVPDIDRTLAELASRGRPLIDREGRPGSRRGRIGFLHPEALGGVLLHLVERRDRAARPALTP